MESHLSLLAVTNSRQRRRPRRAYNRRPFICSLILLFEIALLALAPGVFTTAEAATIDIQYQIDGGTVSHNVVGKIGNVTGGMFTVNYEAANTPGCTVVDGEASIKSFQLQANSTISAPYWQTRTIVDVVGTPIGNGFAGSAFSNLSNVIFSGTYWSHCLAPGTLCTYSTSQARSVEYSYSTTGRVKAGNLTFARTPAGKVAGVADSTASAYGPFADPGYVTAFHGQEVSRSCNPMLMPDLAAAFIAPTSSGELTCALGQGVISTEVSVNVSNNGAASTSDLIGVSFELVPAAGGAALWTDSCAVNMPVGQNFNCTVSQNVQCPADETLYSYRFNVCVDPADDIDESNEGNNCSQSATFLLPEPSMGLASASALLTLLILARHARMLRAER